MPTSFQNVFNNIATTALGSYTAGSGTLNVASVAGITIGAGQWIRVSTYHSGVPVSILKATAVTNTNPSPTGFLTIAGAIEGTVDGSLVNGDPVEMRITAGALSDIHSSVNTLETRLGKISCGGRLTLTSGDPIGSSLNNSTVYYTPYTSDMIGLFDVATSRWDAVPFLETSFVAPSPAGVYDVFAYNNNGTMTIELVQWATTVARSVSLTRLNGILVKSTNGTRRYIGTLYSDGSFVYDNAQFRGLWNCSNKLARRVAVRELTNSVWTYNGNGVWRAVNNNVNGLSYINVIVGFVENPIMLNVLEFTNYSGNLYTSTGIGFDSPTIQSCDMAGFSNLGGTTRGYIELTANLVHYTPVGLHTYWWIENSWGGEVLFYQQPYVTYNMGISGVNGLFYC